MSGDNFLAIFKKIDQTYEIMKTNMKQQSMPTAEDEIEQSPSARGRSRYTSP
jgi:hypothetical protein